MTAADHHSGSSRDAGYDPEEQARHQVTVPLDAVVCASCGRTKAQPEASDCDDPGWHDALLAEPAPEPALQGADLARHLRGRLAYAEDQVQLATQLIIALLLQKDEPLARITDEQLADLDAQAGRHVLQTWRDPATRETVYRVVTR